MKDLKESLEEIMVGPFLLIQNGKYVQFFKIDLLQSIAIVLPLKGGFVTKGSKAKKQLSTESEKSKKVRVKEISRWV
jgi:hypothetical protein